VQTRLTRTPRRAKDGFSLPEIANDLNVVSGISTSHAYSPALLEQNRNRNEGIYNLIKEHILPKEDHQTMWVRTKEMLHSWLRAKIVASQDGANVSKDDGGQHFRWRTHFG
jgi:hypothetical protein